MYTVYSPYSLQIQQTLERILSTVVLTTSEDFPLIFRIADGLDGSGYHTIYNQQHTNSSTKNFILFCFKPISIHTASGKVVWKNISPNSPFSQRSIFSNVGFGLKDFSEEGTESCNKLIRKYRENSARKNSFETNLMDIFVRLASQSDPISVSYRRSLTCERCGQSGHSIRTTCCESHNIQDPSNIALFASLTCSS